MNVLNYIRFYLLLINFFITVGCQPSPFISETEDLPNKDINLSESERQMVQWLNYLCSKECAGRYVGSEGNRKAGDYIISELMSMGFEPSIQEFNVADAILRNIVVDIAGTKDSCIVIGAHYDGQFPSTNENHYPAANDNASGVVTLLRVANDIIEKGVNCHYSIRLCFWDGEENTLGRPFKGSDYFVRSCPELNNIKYYYNLDSVGHDHENKFRVYYYGNWVEQRVIPFILNHFTLNITEIAYRGRGEGSSDYVSFSKEGVPIINIVNDHSSGCKYHYHTVSDLADAISIPMLSIMAEIVENVMIL